MRMRQAGLGMVAALALLAAGACGDDDETVESSSDTGGGEVADGQEPDQEELDDMYVGLSKEDAIAAAEEAGVPWRIEREDGEEFALTMDYRPDRVNFSVEDGEITAVRAG